MARSLSSAATLFAALSETAALMASRRGFSAAAAGSSAVNRAAGSIEEKAVLRKKNTEAEKSWVPDPVTGYYRPGNRSGEVDPVELRELLLSRRSQQ